MANLNIHPAPGLGDLTSGFFVVPQNPLQLAAEGVSRVPSLGEFLVGSFVVPQNPFWAYAAGMVQPLGQGAAGHPILNMRKGSSGKGWGYDTPDTEKGMGRLGCGGGAGGGTGGCGCGCSGAMGMGDITTDMSTLTSDITAGNYSNAFSDTIMGFPAWAYLVGAAALYFFLAAPSEGASRIHRGRRRLASAIAP